MAKTKLTMTIMDVYRAMRDAGISSSPARISAGIASGAYPFGKVIATGETGRRTVEIYRVDFDAWLATKTPTAGVTVTRKVIPFARSG
jgi:hypothetical protein